MSQKNQRIRESSETEQEADFSITAVCPPPDNLTQQNYAINVQKAQFELNEFSDRYFTQGFPELPRYKHLLKKSRTAEGEKGKHGLYIFHSNFGKSDCKITHHVHQAYTGHYCHITRSTKC